MSGLSPKAQALIASARRECQAQGADRARIAAALQAQLGTDVLSVQEPVAVAPTASRWLVASAAVGGVGIIAAGLAWLLHADPPSPTPPRQAPPAPQAPIAAPSPATAPEPTTPAASAAPGAKPARPRQAARENLDQEVQLLLRATRAMNAGDKTKALRALDEHRQRFPQGVLLHERLAARAQVLCSLGRVDEGRAEHRQLPAGSPEASRAAQVCDTAASEPPSTR